MFGKQRHHRKRSGNIFFVIFRLVLSVVMFAVLFGGMYAAFKYFSGFDPLKLDPEAVLKNLLSARTPQQFIAALPELKLDKKILGESLEKKTQDALTQKDEGTSSSQNVLFKFLLIADSHNDNINLKKALIQAKDNNPDLKFIIGLGDYSSVGTPLELQSAKKVLDASGLRYFLTSGDHDLWDCRNRNLIPQACFSGVFGPPFQSFAFENFEFLLLDNSDDYKGIEEKERKWIDNELERIKNNPGRGIFVFLHEPLFHPSSEHIMGKLEPALKEQAKDLMFALKEAGVKKVFAGDLHFFSQYNEPVTNLSMATIGAISTERNPQVPRYAVVSVLEDGSTQISDIEIK